MCQIDNEQFWFVSIDVKYWLRKLDVVLLHNKSVITWPLKISYAIHFLESLNEMLYLSFLVIIINLRSSILCIACETNFPANMSDGKCILLD